MSTTTMQEAALAALGRDRLGEVTGRLELEFVDRRKIAVKVIDDRGNEVIKVLDARKALKK